MIKRITLRCVLICIVVLVAICGYKHYQYGNIFADKTSLEDGWETALINDDNYVDKEYEPSLVKLANGECVDERIYPQLQAMFDDARKQGFSITVRSGYRSWEEQKDLWKEEVSRLSEDGITVRDAKRSGVLSVQRPGMSEHQTGLAVDINSEPSASGDALYNWLHDNAHRYGFVLRYPNDKSEITGITYEPCIIKDAAACCSQGFEFELQKGVEPPENDDTITVKGKFKTYKEKDVSYSKLKNAVLE